MSYFNGSTSNAASGAFMVQTMDAKLTIEPGISKVSAGVVSGTFTWNVYKSAAGVNERGVDFYFALGYPTVAQNAIAMTVMEGWNASSNQATLYPPASASVTPTANFANPAAASNLPSSGANFSCMQTANITSAFSYGFSVDANVCKFWIQATTPAVSFGYYFGLYDSYMLPTDDPMPLVAVNLGGATAAVALSGLATSIVGLATREPKQTAVASTNFGVATIPSTTQSWTLSNGGQNDLYSGFNYISRVLLNGRAATGYRGLLKDCWYGNSGTNNGDQINWTLAGVGHTAARAATSAGGIYIEQK